MALAQYANSENCSHPQLDINRDVELTTRAQITLPDIQLKSADRVFRLYVKSLHSKAVYRAEEMLALKRILPEALDCILNPNKLLHEKLDVLLLLLSDQIQNDHRI
ncbi:MAG TPA: hypothetical protein VH796_16460 [Nitrososphaeraceae archaeon]|jgi:hypothetical protein